MTDTLSEKRARLRISPFAPDNPCLNGRVIHEAIFSKFWRRLPRDVVCRLLKGHEGPHAEGKYRWDD